MDRETALRMGLMAAGLGSPMASLIAGVAAPVFDGLDNVLGSTTALNDAKSLEAYYRALEHARGESRLDGDASKVAEIRARIQALLATQDGDDGDDDDPAGPLPTA